MNICTSCQHIATNHNGGWETFRCMSPENPSSINPVNGNKIYRIEFCSNVRLDHGITIDCPWYKEKEILTPIIGHPTMSPAAVTKPAPIPKIKSSFNLTPDDL